MDHSPHLQCNLIPPLGRIHAISSDVPAQECFRYLRSATVQHDTIERKTPLPDPWEAQEARPRSLLLGVGSEPKKRFCKALL
eukprot:1606374-Amphidinium_carterae.1